MAAHRRLVAMPTPLFLEFERVARRHAKRPAVIGTDGTHYSYERLRTEARRLGACLRSDPDIALKAREAVVLISENCVHWPIVSLGIQAAGAVEFPRETSIDPQELREFLGLSKARLVFLQNRSLLRLLPATGTTTSATETTSGTTLDDRPGAGEYHSNPTIVLMETGPDEPAENSHNASIRRLADLLREGDDFEISRAAWPASERFALEQQPALDSELNATAAVIRTSGTTGPPKLVALSHRNFIHGMRTIPRRLDLGPADRFLSCLPPWHLFARLEHYAAFQAGAALFYCEFEEVASKLLEVRPTVFPGFPEIWERVYHEIRARVHARGLLSRMIFRAGLAISIAYHRRLDRNARSLTLSLLHRVADRLIHRGIRAQLGGELRAAIIGDAPLPTQIDEALRAFGVPVLEGYGSTEQCVSTLRSVHHNRIGAAGPPLEETRVRIRTNELRPARPGESGDILVAGPQVFAGYYRGPGRLAIQDGDFCEFDGERYYITGDVGLITPAGDLRVLGRRRNQFALANGAVVHPEIVENAFRTLPYIDRVVVAGRGLAAPVALISPDFAAVTRYLRDQAPARLRRLAPPRLRRLQERHARNRRRDQARLRRILVHLPVVQYLFVREAARALRYSGLDPRTLPDRIVLLDRQFEIGRELTPTLKPRRQTIESLYASNIAETRDASRSGATLLLWRTAPV